MQFFEIWNKNSQNTCISQFFNIFNIQKKINSFPIFKIQFHSQIKITANILHIKKLQN
jgi:hypothetical protein